jgi:hypothetical protein
MICSVRAYFDGSATQDPTPSSMQANRASHLQDKVSNVYVYLDTVAQCQSDYMQYGVVKVELSGSLSLRRYVATQ